MTWGEIRVPVVLAAAAVAYAGGDAFCVPFQTPHTLVVFLSDHGYSLWERNFWRYAGRSINQDDGETVGFRFAAILAAFEETGISEGQMRLARQILAEMSL